jgi:hypothetical protein
MLARPRPAMRRIRAGSTEHSFRSVPRTSRALVHLGAKLGAIRSGLVWTGVDAHGHRLEIHVSEGWGSSPSGRTEKALALQGLRGVASWSTV